jgi:hypothetical protein
MPWHLPSKQKTWHSRLSCEMVGATRISPLTGSIHSLIDADATFPIFLAFLRSAALRRRFWLAPSGRRDECARGCEKDGGRFIRGKHLCTDEGAVDEQRQLRSQIIWALRAQTLGKVFEPSPQFSLVRCCDRASGMIRVRKFRGDIELRAPAIVCPADAFADPF